MKRIVVVGAGFGGLQAVTGLDRLFRGDRNTEILLVSEQNYLLFSPLLPQIASSYADPRHIVQAVREIRGKRRFQFRRDVVQSVDAPNRRLVLGSGTLEYDALILAPGARTDYFNVPGAREHAWDYKSLQHAVELRERIIDLCEHADHTEDPSERRSMLTFVVVGGGYTGIELISEIHDFFYRYVTRTYRGIATSEIRLLVLEASPEVVRGVGPKLVEHARKRLRVEGIEVRTSTRVTRVDEAGVEVNGNERIEARTVIWTAGVRASTLIESLPGPHDRIGRSVVNAHLQLEGARNVWRLWRGEPLETYAYEAQGMLVSLGMNFAVVNLAGIHVSGYFAWLFWNAVHLYKLVELKKQLQVASDWALGLVFPRDAAIVRRPRRCKLCGPETDP